MPVVTEVINFLHELDFLEVHLDEHSQFMDKIVIVESERTYSGMSKPLIFHENRKRFSRFDIIHEVIPIGFYEDIPDLYDHSEKKKWKDARRRNREKQQEFLFDKYKIGSDYVCNTDVDEIWSRDCWDCVNQMMEEEYLYIAPRVRRFMYFVDAIGGIQDYWRITHTSMPNHRRQKGKKRDFTPKTIGWHFTSCYKDPKDLWMKGVGLAQSIGRAGWKEVPTPEECAKILEGGVLPFLDQNIVARAVMPKDDLSWLPKLMQENPDWFPWLPEKYREGVRVSEWKPGI